MLSAVLPAVLLSGCGSSPVAVEVPNEGSVGRDLLAPAQGETRLALSGTQRFLYPLLMPDAAMPVYPEALLSLRMAPVRVCMHVDIGDDGDVIAAIERIDAECVADEVPQRESFVAAVAGVLATWRYEPAIVCTAPDGSEDDPCYVEDRTERPVAVRLDYAFTFSQRDGVPTVERSR